MNLRNIRIGTRLAFAFAFAIASAAALLGLSLFEQQLSMERQAEAAQRQAAGLLAESALRTALLRTSIAIRSMGLETELTQVYRYQAEAEKYRKDYLRLLDEAETGSVDAEVHEVVSALRAGDAKTAKAYTEVLGLLGAFSTEPAVKIITETIAPQLVEAGKQLAKLNVLTQARAAAAVAEARRGAEVERRWVIGVGVIALFVIGVVAWRITVSIVRPLRVAMRSAEEVARGNLAFELDDQGRDEPAQLIAAFNRMRDALSTMVGQVRESADMVAHAAHEIAQGNLDLSTRTEQQASSLQQTSSTMTQLDTTVRQTAGNAAEASRSAQDATRVATAGGAAVERVVGTMREIHASSSKIADIIGVIDGIAFQTNILALNAAVEAARAGEQGRGFAVVASEVRSLASRSGDAARQIKELITRSVERVDLGSQQVEQAGATMNEIVGAIRKVSDIAGEISAATGEQSAGVGEVGRTVAHMDEATQRNAALVEQSAAAAESLQAQAARLVETVSTFKLRTAPVAREPALHDA